MKYELKSILAYLPQNGEAELLNQALFFHKSLKMRIFILRILKQSTSVFQKFQSKKIEHKIDIIKEELKAEISNHIEQEVPHDIIPHIRVGKVVPIINEESKKGGYEFMIVDKSEPDSKSELYKTNLLKIISRAQCPIMLINKKITLSKINKIIIPIDISQPTKKRLIWATLFAKTFNAKVQVVSALNIDVEETQSLAFKNAEKIKNMLAERDVECDIKILKVHNQRPEKVILNYIEGEEPDLVIIRTHQESILSGSKIGRFVEEIVFNCSMPVFTVNYQTKTVATKTV